MKPPFTLIPDPTPADTIAVLERLLADAKRGEIIGIAFAAMCRRRRFFVSAAGEARRSPTFARGMVAALDDELGQRMRGHQ